MSRKNANPHFSLAISCGGGEARKKCGLNIDNILFGHLDEKQLCNPDEGPEDWNKTNTAGENGDPGAGLGDCPDPYEYGKGKNQEEIPRQEETEADKEPQAKSFE